MQDKFSFVILIFLLFDFITVVLLLTWQGKAVSNFSVFYYRRLV